MKPKTAPKTAGVKISVVPPELLAGLKKAKVDAKKLQAFGSVDEKPIYQFLAEAMDAIRLWEKLRAVVAQTGYWPLVIERSEGVWLKSDLMDSNAISASWAKGLKKDTGRNYDKKLGVTGMILQAGLDLDANAWLKKNRLPDPKPEDDEWAMLAEEAGTKLPTTKPNTKFTCVFDVLSKKPKGVSVTLWPTTDGWAVPALMRYGGWNSCPRPHVQLALLRRWKERYDAELVAVAGAVVELRVGKPPKTEVAALDLAREQYSYCDDIVSQGTMTLERLAEGLKNGTVWYFWWD